MSLQQSDVIIFEVIEKEKHRQHQTLELIASENFVSQNVLEARGSVLTNKYAEGYSGRRYYGDSGVNNTWDEKGRDGANR